MAISTDYSLPTFLERAKSVVLSMPVYTSGSSPAAPTAGTFTLYDSNKTVIVTGAITITASVATFSVTAAVLPVTVALSDAWMEEWQLTVDGVVETIRRDCYFCLRSLYNVVNEAMLIRRVSDLYNLKPSSMTNFQGFIDEAWASVQGRLLQDGRRPYLVMNSWALKDVALETTLAFIFSDLDTYMGDGRYQAKAAAHAAAADKAFTLLRLEYDESELNSRVSAVDSVAAVPVIYTNAPRNWGIFGRVGGWPYV